VPDHHRIAAEYDASLSYSASCYEPTEHVRIFTVIVTEGKLREIQRPVLGGDLVETSQNAALQEIAQNASISILRVKLNVFPVDGCCVRRNAPTGLFLKCHINAYGFPVNKETSDFICGSEA
jgi:hypothetical protein